MGTDAALDRTTLFARSGGRISRRQIEALVSRLIAAFGLLFAAQTIPVMLAQINEVRPLWALLFVPTLYAALIVAFVAAMARRLVKVTQGAVTIIYAIGVVTWPMAISSGVTESAATESTATPWLFYLLAIITGMATIAFPVGVAVAYLLAVPLAMAAIRVISRSVTLTDATLDLVYAVILGGAVVLIVTMLRQAALSVDRAQTTALDTYTVAVRQHATEAERVQVDSIVHDSVLTTLLAAARSETPRTRQLAADMAANAIDQLRRAALVPLRHDATTRLSRLSERIAEAAESMGAPFQVRISDVGSAVVPLAVGDAVYSAAVQAMVNSVQHAGTSGRVRRWVTVRGHLGTGIEVEVGDSGGGFDPGAVPPERLGVRVSILELVASVGGEAHISTAPHEGTVASIRWPGAS